MNKAQIIPSANQELIEASGANELLSQIRPHWQSKNLIQRVQNLLMVDPSSACQRIFNAAIYDLKEKIIIAGIDIAGEAAKQHKLPTINKTEDVESLSASKVLELSHRMGLLTRPEYRKLLRVYDIRKDLEHEDDEYEAGIEDCVYVFKTTIDIVLSKDPIHLIKLTDFKEIVEKPEPATIGDNVLEDYKSAPQQRQAEIYKFLFYSILKEEHPEIIRQNCYNVISKIKDHTVNPVILDLANEYNLKLGRNLPLIKQMRAANAAGILPYFKSTLLSDFYKNYYKTMKEEGFSFKSNNSHGELLRNLIEIGGLKYLKEPTLTNVVRWLIQCYIGEPSYGYYRTSRKTFHSNVGAQLSLNILKESSSIAYPIVVELGNEDREIMTSNLNKNIENRFQNILDELQ
jgi:uncharacterized protein YihD (DUF1040 family)